MKKSQPYYNLIILFLFCLNLAAQDSTAIKKLNAFTRHFNTFAKDYPQEKVYLHFDNTAYFQGETIWFKAYVVRADINTLSTMSKTLYAELITPEGNIAETKKLKIENGQCHGEFQLQDSLFSGFYEVRAYTRYMLNQDKEYLFSRVIPVYEKSKKNNGDYSNPRIRERNNSQRIPQFRKEYEQKGKLALSFYPEGGNLVKGLHSKVAFKATGKEGDNAVITGNILNQKGISVAELNSGFEGMGSFEFTPDSGKYTAKIQYNNKDYTFNLPDALQAGYVMSVSNSNEEKITILIQQAPNAITRPLGITISCRGKLYGFEQVIFGKGNEMLLTFPTKALPAGVTQLTLFNTDGEVLSERLVFVNHHNEMKIDVTQDKRSYQPFEKVNLDFKLNDIEGYPFETTFSVAVRDASSSSYNPYKDNILTSLLLSSELKGYIENPGYYFETENPARKDALDLLMLTQGWSRYVWKEMAGVIPHIEKCPIEDGLVIEGTVLSVLKKKPKQNVDVMFVLMSDSTSQHGTGLTDKDGKFNFTLEDFYGKSKLTLQTKEENVRKENVIQLDRAFSPETKIYAFHEKTIPESVTNRKDTVAFKEDTLNQPEENGKLQANPAMNEKIHKLKEVEVQASKKFRREGESLRDANIVYNVEKNVDEMLDKGEDEPSTALDFIRQKNSYFTYETEQLNIKTYIKGFYKGKSVIFVLNNNSLKDTIDVDDKVLCNYERLAGLLSNEIETVTVCETEGLSLLYGGKSGSEVVIFIYNYKNFHVRTAPVGIRTTKLDGYTYSREFYNPNYGNSILPDEKDYRRTLYWNPDVRTDNDGKVTISFYNNSSCKVLNISAETVTEDGLIGVLNK